METISKQFEVWAIAWRRNIFFRTRVKITLGYFAVFAIIVSIFSYSFYSVASRHVAGVIRLHVRGQPIEQGLVYSATNEQIREDVISADIILLCLALIASYYISGKMLLPIQETLEKQKRFVADASHELRTPLAIMRTDIDILRRSGILTPEIDMSLQSVLDEIKNLTSLSSQLLQLSSFEESSTSLHHTEEDISKTIQTTIKRLAPLASEKQIKFEFDQKNFSIHANHKYIEHAITNVIMNAIKYTNPGDDIKVDVAKNNNNIILKISDHGPGIPKKDLPHIFDRFYKSDTSRNESGSGLGLSIVKAIITAHGGNVRAESELGKGTTIIIELPIRS